MAGVWSFEQRRTQVFETATQKCRSGNFRGTARIRLDNLSFNRKGRGGVDWKNVSRLKKLFKAQRGCWRLNPENHIDAVITVPHLARAIKASQTSEEQLKRPDDGYPPELIFPSNFEVECYHGHEARDRIEAAKQLLFGSDRWWAVDLFLDGINNDCRAELDEQYDNSLLPNNGEIYRMLFYCRDQGNAVGESRWWAYLSESKRGKVRQVLKHVAVVDGFNRFLPFPGLWSGDVRLGVLKTMLAL